LTRVTADDIIGVRKKRPSVVGEGILVAVRHRELSMKLEEFAYSVADRTLRLLETEHHYKVPDHVRKEIFERIAREINGLVAGQTQSRHTEPA